MTPPCPAPAVCGWAVLSADGAHPAAYALVSAAGLRFIVARDGETWTVYDASGTILRDGVRPDRLPAVLLALVGVPAPDPTADRAQIRALGER